jgi:ferredoxin
LQIVDGKARLVSDLHCDGLGACIGECPQGAISFEEREAQPYDEARTMEENIIPKGMNMIKTHLQHLAAHGQYEYLEQAKSVLDKKGITMNMDIKEKSGCSSHGGGCPGSRVVDRTNQGAENDVHSNAPLKSQLRQWPVQLHLVNPHAPYLQNADLLIAADCVPFAYANFHERFLKNRVVLNFCPKLDRSNDFYIEKLAEVLNANDIRSITVVHMEVPCCGGTLYLIEEAMRRSGKNVIIKDYTVSLEGEII